MLSALTQKVKGSINGKANGVKAFGVKLNVQLPFLGLLENGSLIDTTLGETVPAGGVVVHPATREEIAYIRTPSLSEMQSRVVSRDAIIAQSAPSAAGLTGAGVIERAIIGFGHSQDGFAAAPIDQSHGFTIRHLSLAQGAQIAPHSRDCVEVLLVHRGQATWRNDLGEQVQLASGDTFTIPRGMLRSLTADSDCEIFVVRGGDDPGRVILNPPTHGLAVTG